MNLAQMFDDYHASRTVERTPKPPVLTERQAALIQTMKAEKTPVTGAYLARLGFDRGMAHTLAQRGFLMKVGQIRIHGGMANLWSLTEKAREL